MCACADVENLNLLEQQLHPLSYRDCCITCSKHLRRQKQRLSRMLPEQQRLLQWPTMFSIG
jgi:hypothetical protein